MPSLRSRAEAQITSSAGWGAPAGGRCGTLSPMAPPASMRIASLRAVTSRARSSQTQSRECVYAWGHARRIACRQLAVGPTSCTSVSAIYAPGRPQSCQALTETRGAPRIVRAPGSCSTAHRSRRAGPDMDHSPIQWTRLLTRCHSTTCGPRHLPALRFHCQTCRLRRSAAPHVQTKGSAAAAMPTY